MLPRRRRYLANLLPIWARHSLATIARNIGVPKDDIRSLLGHGENTITDIYIDLDLDRIDAAMRMVLEELERDTF